MEALRFVQRVTDDTLVLSMPASYREQEVEIIVRRKETAAKPKLTVEEKLAILKKYEGSFPKWEPGPDFEDEMYTQE
ncbi:MULTISPECIES: hypothetical protein [unclassified Spirosoma]|uniref:hypothetical protein n=1 Tax=unclassified Spirosoma TaxID=2621999 RepID=UPI0009614B2B|nr:MULTISPECIES: hypothetical protein [unclassified Spirosoma]MBN8825719.1 hypothetical protein [Spirosoma sp.]OJW76588.1 MAG: hypothetical protein BGO59_05885 [Spirosoma sp. 48-14]